MRIRQIIYVFIFLLSLSFAACGRKAAVSDAGDTYSLIADTRIASLADGRRKAYFLGYERGYTFGTNYEDENGNIYAMLDMNSQKGRNIAHKWYFEKTGYIVGAGFVAESTDFVTLFLAFPEQEDDVYRIWAERRSEDGEVKDRTLLSSFSSREYPVIPQTIAVDKDGYFHLAGQALMDSTIDYYVVSPAGETEYTEGFQGTTFWRFVTLSDGHIAYDCREKSDKAYSPGEMPEYHHTVRRFDASKKKPAVLFEYEEKGENERNRIQAMNVFSEDKLIYATGNGVFLCDYKQASSEKIYTWENYGVVWPMIQDISVSEDGAISMLMNRQSELYLHVIAPSPEEVIEIELAARVSDVYAEAVLEFNKLHPRYRIVIKDDYDETVLRTKLISGEGPVLICSDLIPFSEQKKLWEPLDDVYESADYSNSILPEIVNYVRIDDKIYGIVIDFHILTLITKQKETGWDYDSFLRCIKNNGQLKYIVDNELLPEAKAFIACRMFDNGVEDSFYIDSEKGELRFDTAEFSEMLDMIDRFGPGDNSVPYIKGIDTGETMCNFCYVNTPADLMYFRKVYGEDAVFAGFPSKDGASNLLASSHILAIRTSASDRDKEIAKEFAKLLLSYDAQRNMSEGPNFKLSVRKDVLEEQITAAANKKEHCAMCRLGSFELMGMEDSDKNAVRKELEKIISESRPYYEGSDEYKDILYEEFSEYFKGIISRKVLIERLTGRVGIYLKEHE